MNDTNALPTWVFGYGSLIWRPDFHFIESSPATVSGWKRRFWQGSHDHRGTPDAPGRVVTMIQSEDDTCGGVAYLIEADVVRTTFETLDHREKNGYQRYDVELNLMDGRLQQGVVYIAPINNFAWLGEAPLETIAAQIASSIGPSGANTEYLFKLEAALQKLGFADSHVSELARQVRQIVG